MQTMHPSIMLGSYVWAQDRLPVDEFRLRLDDVNAELDRRGWKGLLVYGDAREHAALAYVSNFIPRMRWGMALVPREGAARLLCSMSSRDIPAMRTMTWIDDVHSGWEWDKAFDPWLARFQSDAVVELATVGFDLMAPPLKAAVARSVGERFRLHRADEILGLAAARKRPRELSMIRAACRLAQAAGKSFLDAWERTGAPESAALESERVARAMAAQDVRTLVSLDGGRTLVPFQGGFEKRPGPLLGYVAVKLAGYWAEVFVTAGGAEQESRQAETAMQALLAAIRPDARVSELHRVAAAALQPAGLHPVLEGSIGHGIGLSLCERPDLVASSAAALVQDGV
ncbi:MAG: M24 family metallopeptidase [Hyphomicrobiales bacterium]|nr:M24 family metallopeptidase [Hyphomicrobiales bacterium]